MDLPKPENPQEEQNLRDNIVKYLLENRERAEVVTRTLIRKLEKSGKFDVNCKIAEQAMSSAQAALERIGKLEDSALRSRINRLEATEALIRVMKRSGSFNFGSKSFISIARTIGDIVESDPDEALDLIKWLLPTNLAEKLGEEKTGNIHGAMNFEEIEEILIGIQEESYSAVIRERANTAPTASTSATKKSNEEILTSKIEQELKSVEAFPFEKDSELNKLELAPYNVDVKRITKSAVKLYVTAKLLGRNEDATMNKSSQKIQGRSLRDFTNSGTKGFTVLGMIRAAVEDDKTSGNQVDFQSVAATVKAVVGGVKTGKRYYVFCLMCGEIHAAELKCIKPDDKCYYCNDLGHAAITCPHPKIKRYTGDTTRRVRQLSGKF